MELNLKSGWAYCSEQILELCNDLRKTNKLNLLELGGGDSSVKIFNYLLTIYNEVHYTCYETNPKWAPNHKGINVVMYDHPKNVYFDNTIYDLILVDGPTGVNRKLWYNKLTSNIQPGTIIHIDDYDHYEAFEQELKLNFSYNELYRKERSRRGEKSWLTVKIK
tara:strand:- start:1287 stop:1778 length:492 start_codon:yes stop_codon:yes gene_type:complete